MRLNHPGWRPDVSHKWIHSYWQKMRRVVIALHRHLNSPGVGTPVHTVPPTHCPFRIQSNQNHFQFRVVQTPRGVTKDDHSSRRSVCPIAYPSRQRRIQNTDNKDLRCPAPGVVLHPIKPFMRNNAAETVPGTSLPMVSSRVRPPAVILSSATTSDAVRAPYSWLNWARIPCRLTPGVVDPIALIRY